MPGSQRNDFIGAQKTLFLDPRRRLLALLVIIAMVFGIMGLAESVHL
jgi:hypothetical protein